MNLILFHNNCPDGWAAAYICKKKYPEAKLLPLNHGLNEAQLDDLFAKCDNKDVIMVDYSLRTRELNDKLSDLANSFHILDHHKTAQAALEGASYAIFDMKRSGAGLAWDYLFGKDRDKSESITWGKITWSDGDIFVRPWWVNYTEDQDLWNWALPDSHPINAWLMVQPRNEETWDKIIKDYDASTVADLGDGVRSYVEYYTRSVIAEAQEGIFVFEGRNYKTAVLNIPYAGVSEAGHALVQKGYDIGLAWFERGDGIIQFSLRSQGDTDVSAIANAYGGGGHRNAAGFQVSVKEGRELVDWLLGRVIYAHHCI